MAVCSVSIEILCKPCFLSGPHWHCVYLNLSTGSLTEPHSHWVCGLGLSFRLQGSLPQGCFTPVCLGMRFQPKLKSRMLAALLPSSWVPLLCQTVSPVLPSRHHVVPWPGIVLALCSDHTPILGLKPISLPLLLLGAILPMVTEIKSTPVTDHVNLLGRWVCRVSRAGLKVTTASRGLGFSAQNILLVSVYTICTDTLTKSFLGA